MTWRSPDPTQSPRSGRAVRTRPEDINWMRESTSLQEQALGAFINHAQIQDAVPQRMLDDLASFQRVLFTSHRVRALSDAREDRCTVAGSGSAAQRTRDSKARLSSSARAASVMVVRASRQGRLPVVRFHDIVDAVSASRRHGQPAALCVCAVPGSPPAKCANLRDHAAERRRRSVARALIRVGRC